MLHNWFLVCWASFSAFSIHLTIILLLNYVLYKYDFGKRNSFPWIRSFNALELLPPLPSPSVPFQLPIKIFILLSQPDQKKIHLPPHIHLHNSLFTHFILPPFLRSPILFFCPSFSITFFLMSPLSSPRSSYHFLTLIENICCTSLPTFMFIVPSLLNLSSVISLPLPLSFPLCFSPLNSF